jgi:hypothetical protein
MRLKYKDEIIREYCKLTGKYIIIFAIDDCIDIRETQKAIPFITIDDLFQYDCVLCDSEEEVYDLFNRIVGDDGPTELNKYDGPARVHALVCGPNGFETENT